MQLRRNRVSLLLALQYCDDPRKLCKECNMDLSWLYHRVLPELQKEGFIEIIKEKRKIIKLTTKGEKIVSLLKG